MIAREGVEGDLLSVKFVLYRVEELPVILIGCVGIRCVGEPFDETVSRR